MPAGCNSKTLSQQAKPVRQQLFFCQSLVPLFALIQVLRFPLCQQMQLVQQPKAIDSSRAQSSASKKQGMKLSLLKGKNGKPAALFFLVSASSLLLRAQNQLA